VSKIHVMSTEGNISFSALMLVFWLQNIGRYSIQQKDLLWRPCL